LEGTIEDGFSQNLRNQVGGLPTIGQVFCVLRKARTIRYLWLRHYYTGYSRKITEADRAVLPTLYQPSAAFMSR